MRFLFTTLPTNDLGLLTRSLPIARELAARGHDVVFSSPAPAPSRLVADAGFENLVPAHPLYDLIAVDRTMGGVTRFIAARGWRRRGHSAIGFLTKLLPALPIKTAPDTPDIWNMGHAGAVMGMLNERFIRANCETLRALIVDSRAEVVVDFWNPFAVVAARAAGLPVVTVIQADAHPASNGFVWWKPAPATIPNAVGVMNRAIARYGLSPLMKVEDLSVGDLTIVLGTPETDPLPADAAASVTYVGPILWQQADAALPAWIRALPRDRPIVWVYSGNPRYLTGGNQLDSMVVLQASLAALRDAPVHVVLTTGHHALPEEVLPLPANVRHEAYVPGLAMAEQCDLLIHHGGYGSCQTGLWAGKPAVILPTFSERESNARRIAALGAGVVVPVEHDVEPGRRGKRVKRVRVDDLRAAVERVLRDPSFTDNARRVSETIRAYGGATQAATLIDGFAARARAVTSSAAPARRG